MTINSGVQIGVIGPSVGNLPVDESLREKMLLEAEEIGVLLGQHGAVVFTGGQDGVMEAVCRGAKKGGGLTVGTPGRDRFNCNPFVDVEVCTPIDVGDYIFAGVLSTDSLIVFPGGAGTLAELAIAYRFQRPMVVMRGYNSWYDNLINQSLDRSNKMRFEGADSPEDAVELALRLSRKE